MNDRDERAHPGRETLHRHAEGGLDGDAAGEVEAHLVGCPSCRREVEEIRELLRRAAGLPRGIEPPRDLWPGVEARVRAEASDGTPGPIAAGARPPSEPAGDGRSAGPGGGSGRSGTASGLREAAPWLAAAAAVLVAVTAGATLWLAGGGEEGPGGEPGAVAGGAAADTGAGEARILAGTDPVQAGYRPMLDRLTALLESRSDRLPPQTREIVGRNLRIIDAAIAEAESALARHPASPELLRALDRSYQRKIDLLRRSARLTAQM